MKTAQQAFAHCPICGSVDFRETGENASHCPACDFRYHFNPAVAVGALIVDASQRLLLIERARNPGKGLFGIPGGFVDAGESAEEALIREIEEETNLKAHSLRYFSSGPNDYPYQDINYKVLDFFFKAEVYDHAITLEPSEATAYSWLSRQEIDLDRIAFPSIRRAIAAWIERPA